MNQSNTIGQNSHTDGMRHIPGFPQRNNVSPHADSRVAMCRRKTWGKTGIYTRSSGKREIGVSSNIQHGALRLAAQQSQLVGVRDTHDRNAGWRA
jgi:hypothetical protein